MISLTDQAVSKIRSLEKEAPNKGKMLRIFVEAGGCSGLEYGMSFEAQEKEGRLQQHLEQVLADAPRPGSPALFSPEQIIDIIAVACEDPQDSGHPLSHWTPSALAREVIHRQIVASISSRQVGRFLKRGGFKAAPESLLAAPPI